MKLHIFSNQQSSFPIDELGRTYCGRMLPGSHDVPTTRASAQHIYLNRLLSNRSLCRICANAQRRIVGDWVAWLRKRPSQ